MKIAFYLDNVGLGSIDCSKPLKGNPGIGGTQYCFLLLIDSLKRYKPEYQLSVYVNEKTILPFQIDQIVVKDVCEAITHSSAQHNDLFLMKQALDESTYTKIDQLTQNVIVWGHNYYHSNVARWITECRNVVLNVFVGKQQYDRYVDHDIINKSVFVFNMVPPPEAEPERNNDSRTVAFLGTISKGKGFDILARQWKKVLREVPDAQLKVIGSGNLYDRNNRLGRMGIADESFENSLLEYLSGEDGKILDSVHFLGVMGKEKYDVFDHASVGVVNPSKTRESFGLSIIEMNTRGLPVSTVKKNGYLDTVINGETGLLIKKSNHVYKGIIKLLKETELNNRLGKNARIFSSRFSPDLIVKKWIETFENISANNHFQYTKPEDNFLSDFKWLRIFNRFLRITCSLSFIPSIIDIESFAYNQLKKIRAYLSRS